MVHFVIVFCDRELQYEYSSFGLGGLSESAGWTYSQALSVRTA